ncbi:MAG: hypothetical protein NTW28_33140 [Candidatus Solibacter sp.]|nr:hypothetical protein [Candidatus Solibacter sp.]
MGTSSVEETALIEEHLLICEGCQGRLRETDDYLLAMRGASQQQRRDERTAKGREWRFPAWFPALAAVACGLLLVVVTPRFVRAPGPVVAVSLTALRGNGAGNSAPAGRELMLQPDLTGLGEDASYRLEIVDLTGHPVRQGTLARAQSGIKVRGLNSGQYYVRVYRPAGDLLREYGLEIH